MQAPVAPATEGRPRFVDTALNKIVDAYEISLEDDVRRFILDEVLESDDVWDAAIAKHELDARRTERILDESLAEAARSARSKGHHAVVQLDDARMAFRAVAHDRHDCPFPFIC